MEARESRPKSWSSPQVYGLSVICLLLGIGAGYLVHAPSQVSASVRQTGRPTATNPANVTPEQLRHMADKQAEPLLAKLRQTPDDAALLAEIGKIYLLTRQFPTATEYYERSVQAKPNAKVLTTLGGAYHFAGDDEKAIGAWNRALALDPKSPDALYNIGLIQWQAHGDAKSAIATWQKFLKTNPQHPKRAQVEKMIAQAKKHMNMPAAGQ
jgi:cytochrome c-type biogenesis protein CcmH/NrfG